MGGGLVDDDKPLDSDSLDPFQVPADEVLGEFRAKVQQTVRPEDVQTHYDLGIAYKEMGLVDEAIAEFELAVQHARGPRGADCLTMLGMCELERGHTEQAVEKFQRGLELPDLTVAARRALMFELGGAFETAGKTDEAVEQYMQVSAEDATFRDVQARIDRLGGPREVPAVAKPAAQRTAAPSAALKTAASARGASPSGKSQTSAPAEPESVPEPPYAEANIGSEEE